MIIFEVNSLKMFTNALFFPFQNVCRYSFAGDSLFGHINLCFSHRALS